MPHWPDPSSRSAALYQRGLDVLPGGITRLQPWQEPFPVYAARGEGAYVVDVDGTRRLDFLNNFASLLHGHAYAPIVEAVCRQVALGTAFTNPTESEVQLAELLCRRVAGFENVRFCVSGTEAVMNAIKASRALTGKPMIVKVEGCYHGTYDYAEVSLDPAPDAWGNEPRSVGHAAGTPQGVLADVAVIPFDDPEAAERIIAQHADRLAAVLVDVAPSYLGMQLMSREFAAAINRAARAAGAMIISDEVISFRFAAGGAAALVGLEADFTTLAKIVGGGFPVGAVAGPRDTMRVFDHRAGKPLLPASGTFTANPVSMVAGRLTLEHMPPERFDALNAMGAALRARITERLTSHRLPAQITGTGSTFMLHLNQRALSDYRSMYPGTAERAAMVELQRLLTLAGYQLSPRGMGFLSTAMIEADLDGFVDALMQALGALDLPTAT
ncbi:aspartate aminotransferase family protein [Acuticoccus sp. I52.16.1]|uniref:aspartate aminotransferase family protein n=1 Tax=Acuticoccus sp. I52.16.1 TaxID=2928472 RepID=UPI001FD11981|nr:aminotransferase class III-fold pyridoxal phosphate-dependent enzyme [Acuticoccus sp. I52.16.1]UOM35474.1 aminotransferase class III-fold pyridoxal phosphate-dependent enzyme [Acuticoccus sp. I52.16.1]